MATCIPYFLGDTYLTNDLAQAAFDRMSSDTHPSLANKITSLQMKSFTPQTWQYLVRFSDADSAVALAVHHDNVTSSLIPHPLSPISRPRPLLPRCRPQRPPPTS